METMYKHSKAEVVLFSKRRIGHSFLALCEMHSHPQTAAAVCGTESLRLNPAVKCAAYGRS